MQVAYVDTSVVVSLLFERSKNNAEFLKIMNHADEVLSSNLMEAELLSVLRRDRLNFSEALNFLAGISLVLPDRSLLAELGRVFAAGYVRGADAFHLACALYLDPQVSDLVFLTVDKKQDSVAAKIGFRTFSSINHR